MSRLCPLKTWQILSLSTILLYSTHFVLRVSWKKICSVSVSTYDKISCVERDKRLSLSRAFLILVLLNSSKWVSLSCDVQFVDTFIRNYISNEILTACASYFKCYEKSTSMNLNCHIFSFLSVLSETMHCIKKHWKKKEIFRFCFLIFSSLKNINCKSCRTYISLKDM